MHILINKICFSIYLRQCDNDDTFWDHFSGIVFPSLWLFCRLSFTTLSVEPHFVESGHRVWPSLTVPLFHHLIEGRGFLGSARLCLVEWVQITMNIHEPSPLPLS